MTNEELVNEYIQTFKNAYQISDKEWNEDCEDSYFRPIKEAIKNMTYENLKTRLSNLIEWGISKGRL